MDVRIEAAPMTAEATVVTPTLEVFEMASVNLKALSTQRVASFSCPTLGSHSISAVAPDKTFIKEDLAHAA
jgi:hypothetical protein